MASFGFAPVSQAMTFPVVDPQNPMNSYYADQAEQHARRHPKDPQAQALSAFGIRSLAQIDQQRRMHMQAAQQGQWASSGPMGPAMPGAQPAQAQWPAPVSSNLLPGAEVPPPTPPASQAAVGVTGEQQNLHCQKGCSRYQCRHKKQQWN